jgi:pilus assembly protein CpaB
MNPLQSIIMQLSRVPIALLLVVIVFVSGIVAVSVTSIISENIRLLNADRENINRTANAKGKIVRAVKDIQEGQTIASDALQESDIVQSKIPEDAITQPSLAVGRVAKYGIVQGAIISQHDIAPQGIALGFEAKLKSGMRAVTFGVDNNSGVAGFVNPDSRVDILAMVGSGAETKVAPILSDVEVIAVGQLYQKSLAQSNAIPSSSVTVSVNPTDTTKLIKAISASKLYLALRSYKDHTPVATVDVTSMFACGGKEESTIGTIVPPPPVNLRSLDAEEVNGIVGAKTADPPPVPMHEIEVWKSSAKDVLTFPSGG